MNNRDKYHIDNKDSVQGQVIGENNQLVQNFHSPFYSHTFLTPEEAEFRRLRSILRASEWKHIRGIIISFMLFSFTFCSISTGGTLSVSIAAAVVFLPPLFVCITITHRRLSRFVKLKTGGKFNSYMELHKEVQRMKKKLEG